MNEDPNFVMIVLNWDTWKMNFCLNMPYTGKEIGLNKKDWK